MQKSDLEVRFLHLLIDRLIWPVWYEHTTTIIAVVVVRYSQDLLHCMMPGKLGSWPAEDSNTQIPLDP